MSALTNQGCLAANQFSLGRCYQKTKLKSDKHKYLKVLKIIDISYIHGVLYSQILLKQFMEISCVVKVYVNSHYKQLTYTDLFQERTALLIILLLQVLIELVDLLEQVFLILAVLLFIGIPIQFTVLIRVCREQVHGLPALDCIKLEFFPLLADFTLKIVSFDFIDHFEAVFEDLVDEFHILVIREDLNRMQLSEDFHLKWLGERWRLRDLK